MAGSPEKPAASATSQSPTRRLVVWLASGVLSGAMLACLFLVVRGLCIDGLPAPVHPDSSSNLPVPVALRTAEYVSFLVRTSLHDTLAGSFWGMIGGLVTALVSSYYPRAGWLIGATILWAGLAAGFALLLCLVLAVAGLGTLEALWKAILLAPGVGAAYGAILVAFYRLFESILRLANPRTGG